MVARQLCVDAFGCAGKATPLNMSGTTFRRNGIHHPDGILKPSPLMPGYCGHVPAAKFQYGITFGNATRMYFQSVRFTSMAYTAPSKGGMFPHIFHLNGRLVSTQHSQSRDRPLYNPYWARYNIDFKRQEEIRHFDELTQKHRTHYTDKTGTVQPVSYFIMPEKKLFSQVRTRSHTVAHTDRGLDTA